MSIKVMVSEEKAFEPNVTVVMDYPGHEAGRTVTYGEGQSVTYGPLFMEETFVGCVLSLREANFHDDSDFYARVWDETIQAPREVQYATTRGWSYPNHATVDATPEVLAKLKGWVYRQSLAELFNESVELSKVPAKGKRCIVVKGRKIQKGEVVTVLNIGAPRKFGFYGPATVNAFVKVESTGNMLKTNVNNLEVIEPEQYVQAPETFEAKARQISERHDRPYIRASHAAILAAHLR